MDDKWDKRFLEMADLVATWSKDPSTQTGAVIVRPDRTVASVGYNGFPKQMPDLLENYNNREVKYSRIVHCEMNALLHIREPAKGYTLYTTGCSCDRCFVRMVQAGINRFVFYTRPSMDERWKAAFDKTMQYARECRVSMVEYSR